MNFLKKYRHTWVIPAYGILYLLAFQYVEQRSVRPHIIHMKVDDYIPFCEYFIIPYYLWFIFIAVTVFYFALFNKNKKEYWQLVCSLGIGMTLFIIIYLIFPNGQELRPSLSGDSIFIELVQYLYKIDTHTNVFPSIHVFNTVACCIAIFHHKTFHHRKLILAAAGILGTLIVLSTIFLKQHTLLDVVGAVVLNVFCYQLLYKPKAVQEKQPARIRV